MIDYILAVQSPPEWHAANIQQNRHHYSFLRSFGPQAVDWVAERIGVGVHFNTLVPWRDRVSHQPSICFLMLQTPDCGSCQELSTERNLDTKRKVSEAKFCQSGTLVNKELHRRRVCCIELVTCFQERLSRGHHRLQIQVGLTNSQLAPELRRSSCCNGLSEGS